MHTRRWLEEVVIGLNLCPFARQPYTLDRIRYVVEPAEDIVLLAKRVVEEARWLMEQPKEKVATTLLIHPRALLNFLDYNDFLSEVDLLIKENSLEGKLQAASFHPDYQFAGTRPADAENFTNRSPYPMIHLIREAMLEEVLDNYPDPESIPERNIKTMNQLGAAGIRKIWEKIIAE